MQTPTNFPKFSTEILPRSVVHNNLKSHTIVDEDTKECRSRSRSAEREVSLAQLRAQIAGHDSKDFKKGKPRNKDLDNGNGVFRQKYCRKLSYGLDNDVDLMFYDAPKSSKLDQAKHEGSNLEESYQRGLDRTQNIRTARDRFSSRENCSDFLRGLSASLRSTHENELSEPGRFSYQHMQKEVLCIEDEDDPCALAKGNEKILLEHTAINRLNNVKKSTESDYAIVIDDNETDEEVDEMKIYMEAFDDNEGENDEETPQEIPLSNDISLHNRRPAKMEWHLEEKHSIIRDPRRSLFESSLQGTGAGSTPEKCIVLDDDE